MKMTRLWAMPNKHTFNVKPINDFIRQYLTYETISVDPFYGMENPIQSTFTNDLNPNVKAQYNLDAEEFLSVLKWGNRLCDILLFDPPYSPRQISECYKGFGREVTMKDTQSACMYSRVRNAAVDLVKQGGWVLSFGWNTVGMGKGRGFSLEEILLVCHGGAHNDTICIAERKL